MFLLFRRQEAKLVEHPGQAHPEAGTWAGQPLAVPWQLHAARIVSSRSTCPLLHQTPPARHPRLCSAHFLPEKHGSVELTSLLLEVVQDSTAE